MPHINMLIELHKTEYFSEVLGGKVVTPALANIRNINIHKPSYII